MSRAADKDVNERDAAGDESPGKVEFDSRGMAIWRWARDKLDSTTVLLKRLDNHHLALEPTQRVPAMKSAPPAVKPAIKPAIKPTSPAAKRDARHGAPAARDVAAPKGSDSGGGFDPYNSR